MKALGCILTVNVWLDKDQLVLWKDKLPNYLSKAAVEKKEFRKKKPSDQLTNETVNELFRKIAWWFVRVSKSIICLN